MTPALVERLRDGDPGAGRALTQLYREALLRFCWGYLGRVDEAEDAVQDVCCKVLASESVPDSFRPWIYKLARNHCLNVLRGRGRRIDGGQLPAASQVLDALTGNLTRLVNDEQVQRVSDLLRELAEPIAEVLRLRYVEELSRGEIAEVLGISESLVKSRLFQGMKHLRGLFSGSDTSSGVP